MTDGNRTTSMGAELPDDAVEAMRRAEVVTVFTGAGMSAESGVATFRDVETGLWQRFDPAQIATPEAWASDPGLVWAWYQWRAHIVHEAAPNRGHRALADLERTHTVLIATQNVDDLHERAGSSSVSHLHGSLFAPRCSNCARPYQGIDAEPEQAVHELRVEPPACPACLSPVRPGVVWFGEGLPDDAWRSAASAFTFADVVLVVGTSGVVYPAAGLPERAAARGIPVIEFNPEPSALTGIATHSIRASAAVGLSAMLDALGASG